MGLGIGVVLLLVGAALSVTGAGGLGAALLVAGAAAVVLALVVNARRHPRA